MHDQTLSDTDIAIIGMSCRFPASKDTGELWQKLREGIECITEVTADQLRTEFLKSLGYVPESALTDWLDNPNYIRVGAGIKDIDLFDAAFFGYNPTEAKLLDPQQRIFLECAWEALEDAACDPETSKKLIGVYAGTETSSYYHNLYSSIIPSERDLLALIGNTNDYLATRVSYKLNLKGPSITVQSACSTSLAAVHLACQSLKCGECDIALAGGVAAYPIQQAGYFYRDDGIMSPDGHCRPFSAHARGTVFANGGVGIVVLKCLTDALADGDHVYAVIKGSAINNDGSLKTGYTAPSIDGQVRVLLEAMAVADVAPETVSYIETHGTATPLGDSIEVAALTRAFRARTQKKNFCAIGSIKSNMGHLGAASGIAGLIKTVLALQHKEIPPSLHSEPPNPQIDFVNSPFYVSGKLTPWGSHGIPRRAGVSSFGLGGTNAHVVLEEAPVPEATPASKSSELLILSAKTSLALENMSRNLLDHLKCNPNLQLADLAFTLQVGRKAFAHRLMLTCQSVAEAMKQLETKSSLCTIAYPGEYSVAFMFPGQGGQYVNIGRELYDKEIIFRGQFDLCAKHLMPYLQCDLRSVVYPPVDQEDAAQKQLDQIFLTQPAVFAVEYAMAQLWISRGIRPKAVIGHSLGEYVAACLAGVFSLEDALKLVAIRGRLMQPLTNGSMLAVSLPEKDILPFLDARLALAATNSTTDCVVAGPTDAIEQLAQHLTTRTIACQMLHVYQASHCYMMDTIAKQFVNEVKKIDLHPPTAPYISNVSGKWITAQEATNPEYWAKHWCQTVRFAEGVQLLLNDPSLVLLEVGPGRSLSTYTQRIAPPDRVILPSLRHAQSPVSDRAFFLKCIGQLWCAGITIDWSQLSNGHQRLSLPTYPFERQRFWVFPRQQGHHETPLLQDEQKTNITDWFSIPSWKRCPLPDETFSTTQKRCWLVFTDMTGLGSDIISHLRQRDDIVITVSRGEQFSKVGELAYILRPQCREDYDALLKDMSLQGLIPTGVIHLWTVVETDSVLSGIEYCETAQTLGFYCLLFLTQALGILKNEQPLQITVVSNNLQDVTGGEVLCPERATIFGISKVAPFEYPHITFRHIDIVLLGSEMAREQLVDQIVAELQVEPANSTVAYRNAYRWVQCFEPAQLAGREKVPLKEHGVYLITGGLGGIGLTLAEYLARTVKAKLALIGRTPLPAREIWEQIITVRDEHDAIANKIRKIIMLEKLGAEVLAINADVTDLEQMQAAVARIQDRFGMLHGVIHAAGIPGGGMMQLKNVEAAASVLAPKVKGTLALKAALKDMHPDFVILCSSLYSITGGLGQVDYCAGNAFLDSFAFYHTAQSGIRTVSINWPGWQKVGMAVDLLTASEASPRARTLEHAESNWSLTVGPEENIYHTELDGNRDWILYEHTVIGIGVVPATALLELARAAFELRTGSKAVEIRDVSFITPLSLEADEKRKVRCTFFAEERDELHFLIESKLTSSQVDDWLVHAEGQITAHNYKTQELCDVSSLKKKMATSPRAEIVKKYKEVDAFVQYGPRWDVLKEVYFQADQGLCVLELATNFLADLEKLYLHPALLDIATNFLAYHQHTTGDVAYLPFFYKKLSIYGPLPKKCLSYARHKAQEQNQEETGEFLVYDITLMDEWGKILVDVEGFTLRKSSTDVWRSQTAASKETNKDDHDLFSITHDEMKERLRSGIQPQEGVEVFKRILSHAMLPQVIVSTRDIHTVLELAEPIPLLVDLEATEQAIANTSYQRPDLQTAYVAPGNEIEQQVAAIWQNMLGIEKVGIRDNFFEVGGDSLTGTRMINQLRKVLAVDLSIRQLFTKPTIEGIAETIMQQRQETSKL